jgi:protein BCP1
MASKPKKSNLDLVTPDESTNSSSDESDTDMESGKEIQVEFEARSPDENDFHGIKRLLQQLFLRNQVVNVSKLAESILAQRHIGSVIKQTVQDADDSDDEEDPNQVYGVSTILNLGDKTKDSMSGLRRFLLEQTAKGNDVQVLNYVSNLLDKSVGFLVSERFINIPAQITVPLLETLVTEMRKARDRNLPYDFTHYFMICKLYKTKNLEVGGSQLPEDQAVIFSNPEEELIVGESELCIDYDVSSESDADASGNWEDGMEMTPWRRIVVFQAEKLDGVIKLIKENFPTGQAT